MTLASSVHSIGTDEWNYALGLILGGIFFFDVIIQLRSDKPELSILGVETGRHSKVSKDLL